MLNLVVHIVTTLRYIYWPPGFMFKRYALRSSAQVLYVIFIPFSAFWMGAAIFWKTDFPSRNLPIFHSCTMHLDIFLWWNKETLIKFTYTYIYIYIYIHIYIYIYIYIYARPNKWQIQRFSRCQETVFQLGGLCVLLNNMHLRRRKI